jgi:hypothetical protein
VVNALKYAKSAISQKKAMSVRKAASHEVRAPRSMMGTLGMRLMTKAANVAAVAVSALMLVSGDIDPRGRHEPTGWMRRPRVQEGPMVTLPTVIVYVLPNMSRI